MKTKSLIPFLCINNKFCTTHFNRCPLPIFAISFVSPLSFIFYKKRLNRKWFFVLAFTCCCAVSFAQYTYQNANSIIVNPGYKANTVSAEASFEFNHFQLTGMYNLPNKAFVYSMLKLNVLQQKGDKFFSGLLGGKAVMLHNNDVGLGIGFGLQDLGSIGNYKMQGAAGYDYEKQRYTFNDELLNVYDDLVDSVSNQHNTFYKVSSNLNFIKIRDKYNFSYLLRVSYCKFTKYQYNDIDATIRNSDFVIVEPAVEWDSKLLKNKNLLVVTQFGLSLPLSNFTYAFKSDLPFDATTETSDYLLDIILKLGVKYNFR